MKEILINEKNKNQFKDSLIKSLSCDINEVDIKVNKELLETYLNNITSKDDINLLDPLIVKISKFKNLYDLYLEKILKINYNEYFLKTKVFLNESSNLDILKKYSLDNIDNIDLNNEIEYEISKIFNRYILKHKLNSIKNQKWFIKYILKKEMIKYNIDTDIIFSSPSNIDNYKLLKKSSYKEYEFDKKNIIDLKSFNIIKNKDYNKAMINLLNNAFIYLQNIIFNTNTNDNYNTDLYTFMKETIIYKLSDNRNLKINPLFDNVRKLNIIDIDTNDININEEIDNLVFNNKDLLNEYPLLKYEYNDNGIKKTLRELLDSKIIKIKSINDKKKEFNRIIKETDNDIVLTKITADLNELESNTNSINTFHNNLIYDSLKLLSILDLTKLLTQLKDDEIETLKDAAIEEKNNIIKRLENNRKKIFKPDTFLKNEEILTKEYSKAAGYESKINDYNKKKSSRD